MPPSRRDRRWDAHAQPPPPQELSDLESEEIEEEEGFDADDPRVVTSELAAGDMEEEEVEVEEPLASPQPSPHNSPIPPTLREISNLASWTVSSSKPGCSIPQLRSPSTSLFWQSDGPQPHYLNIHFSKLVRIVGLRLYLDFEADESYTPTRILFLAGSGHNDLVEWGEMRLEQPRGWVWVDFSGVDDPSSEEDDSSSDIEDNEGLLHQTSAVDLHDTFAEQDSDFENSHIPAAAAAAAAGSTHAPVHGSGDPMAIDAFNPYATPSQTAGTPSLPRTTPRLPLNPLAPNAPSHRRTHTRKAKMPVLRAHLVQVKILENHQNGKDTHLRGLQIFARDNEEERGKPKGKKQQGKIEGAFGNGQGEGKQVKKSRSRGRGLGLKGLSKSAWDVEPSIR